MQPEFVTPVAQLSLQCGVDRVTFGDEVETAAESEPLLQRGHLAASRLSLEAFNIVGQNTAERDCPGPEPERTSLGN